MKNPITYQVIEDNAGTLYFFVWAKNVMIYGSPMLAADVMPSIADIKFCDFWESHFENAQESYDSLTSFEYGWEVVADENGVYESRMGVSACEAFSL